MISGNNFYDSRKHYKQKIKICECKKRIKKHHAFQQVYATEKDDLFFNFITHINTKFKIYIVRYSLTHLNFITIVFQFLQANKLSRMIAK